MKNIYIASCTDDGGIYRIETDGKSFEIKEKTSLPNPMYMTVYNKKMYVLLRSVFDGDISGMCTFNINSDGSLSSQSEIIPTKGVVACHICASDSGVYAVNYVSGSVIKFPGVLKIHSGRGVNPARQESPHTHCVIQSPDKKYICVTDLGLDKIFFYDTDLNEKFTLSVPSGCGARHLAFSDDGKYLYCVNELISSVSVFEYDGENSKALATYPALPDDFKEKNLAAAIRVHNGRLYVSNRGHDSIAVFDIKGEKLELLHYIKTGSEPRDFNISGDVIVSCNMLGNSVTFYSISDGYKKIGEVEISETLCAVFD